MIAEPLPFAEAVAFLKQQKAAYTEAEAITIIWSAIMGSVDWSRKPEQYEEQALKSTKVCGPSLKRLREIIPIQSRLLYDTRIGAS